MSSINGFKKGLSTIVQLWEEGDYKKALAKVDALQKAWPGNAHLQILWASLVQLQEDSNYELDDVKEGLQKAVSLDKGSPAASIELGHFLDSVVDEPEAASVAFAEEPQPRGGY